MVEALGVREQRWSRHELAKAMKGPKSANLDRVQIVKGGLDAAGTQHEKVFDAVWSGDRKIGGDGKLLPVGNTMTPSG